LSTIFISLICFRCVAKGKSVLFRLFSFTSLIGYRKNGETERRAQSLFPLKELSEQLYDGTTTDAIRSRLILFFYEAYFLTECNALRPADAELWSLIMEPIISRFEQLRLGSSGLRMRIDRKTSFSFPLDSQDFMMEALIFIYKCFEKGEEDHAGLFYGELSQQGKRLSIVLVCVLPRFFFFMCVCVKFVLSFGKRQTNCWIGCKCPRSFQRCALSCMIPV
jgi:hypothetical protein